MLAEEIDYICFLALEDMPFVSAEHHDKSLTFSSHELCAIRRLVVKLYFNYVSLVGYFLGCIVA